MHVLVTVLVVAVVAAVAGVVVLGLAVRRQSEQIEVLQTEAASAREELAAGLRRATRDDRATQSQVAGVQSSLRELSDALRATDEEIQDALPDWSTISDAVSASVLRVTCETDVLSSSGSGFAVASDRPGTTIVTNRHVVEACEDGDGVIGARQGPTTFDVELVTTSADPDVAVLSTTTRIPPLEVGDTPQEADPVMAIGTPLGDAAFENTKTFGRISKFEDLVQHDAPVNFGSSGGPLIDRFGKVIAVNTYKGNGEGLSLAIRMRDVCVVVGC